MASSRNISFDTVTDLENVRYLNDKDFEKENSRSQLTINDILLTTVATLGRSCIYNGFPENLCFQRSVTVITTSILPQYLKIFFDASYFQDFIINNATGTAQKGFYLNQLESVLVCVPPAKEQNRLTTKIQQMLSGIQKPQLRLFSISSMCSYSFVIKDTISSCTLTGGIGINKLLREVPLQFGCPTPTALFEICSQ